MALSGGTLAAVTAAVGAGMYFMRNRKADQSAVPVRWDPEVPYDDRTHMPHWLGSRFTAQESPGKREEYVSPPAAPGALEMRELEQQRRARAASAAAGFQARRGEVEQLGPSVAEVAARDNVVFPGPTLGT